jgi:hypothetical protein
MVKLTLKEIRIDGPLTDQISATVLNDAAGRYAKEMNLYLKGKVCDQHPKMNQEIVVTADRASKLIVQKENFCCEKFSDSIRFEPKL